jgi:hypothetical protein
MQSSRNIPSRTNRSFSSTRVDAVLRVSVSAWPAAWLQVYAMRAERALPALTMHDARPRAR